MLPVSTRSHFGSAGRSFDGVRESVELPRPVAVSQIAAAFGRELVFNQPLVTADGVALGGSHRLTLLRNGDFTYEGHFRATGFPSFDASVATTLAYSVPNPGGGEPLSARVAFAASGHVSGFNEPGDREYRWSQTGNVPFVKSHWPLVRTGRFERQLQYDTDWFGPVGDVANFLAQVLALGTTLGGLGVAIVLAGTAADALNLEELVLPGMVGVLVAGGAGFVFGPVAMFPAFVMGAAVTAATVKQRPMSYEEREFADHVFRGRIPYDRVVLTNLLGFGDRPFAAPGPGGAILLNIGAAYDNPATSRSNGREDEKAPGQLLIHELVHAWQITNESFTPEYYCRAVTTAGGTAGGDMAAYAYGAPGGAWDSFGTEQQAAIVDGWYAGKNHTVEGSPQYGYEPCDERNEGDGENTNPYFRYIRDNIRTGIA